MIRTLQRHGNSVALVVDKTMLEALNMTPDTPVQVTLHAGHLTITPVHVGVGRERMSEIIGELRPRYKTMLENLAK
jgi:antitoxin component of MazEF toxin-antitoxin module